METKKAEWRDGHYDRKLGLSFFRPFV